MNGTVPTLDPEQFLEFTKKYKGLKLYVVTVNSDLGTLAAYACDGDILLMDKQIATLFRVISGVRKEKADGT